MRVMADSNTQPATSNQHATARPPNALVRGWRRYEQGLGRVVAAASGGNRRLGAWENKSPIWIILIAAVFTACACVGWVRFRMEDSSDVLWVPQTGKAQDDKAYVRTYYPNSQSGASFYAELAPSRYSAYGGDNALQIPVTWEMFQLHNAITALSVNDAATGKSVSFADICYKTRAGTCSKGGYLDFWNWDFNTFIANVSGSPTDPAVGNENAFRNQVSQLQYPDGSAVSLLAVFGGTSFNFTPSFRLASAQVIAVDYSLDASVDSTTATNWQDAFRDLMFQMQPQMQYSTIIFITGASLGEELNKAITGDMRLIIISFIVFIVLAVAFLSKLDSVLTHSTLALLGVLCVALGIIAGWGWGMMFGMPFTPLQELSPFILLGMGVDVIFILVKAYEIIVHREPGLTLGEAFGQLMATAGLSTQVTLVASAVAFALGAVCTLPSVQWFSAYAALNTAMICVLMSTMFIGFFVFTERRIASRRRDLCCCAPCAKAGPAPGSAAAAVAESAETPTTSVSLQATSRGPAADMSAPTVQAIDVTPGAPTPDPLKENWMKRLFRVYYAPFLARWWVKVIVLLVFLGYGIYSCFAIAHVQYGQPLSDLAPDGSYLIAYSNMYTDTYQTQVGQPTGLYFRDLNFEDPVIQGKMLSALDQMLSNQYINASTSGFQGNWYISFNQWAANLTTMVQAPGCTNPYYMRATGPLAGVVNPSAVAQQISGCVPAAQFYPLLVQWLAIPHYAGYGDSIIRDATGNIITTSFTVMQVAPGNDDKFTMEFITSIRSLEDDLNSNLFSAQQASAGTYVVFTYNSNYVFYEGDELLPGQALEYFLLAMAGVGVVVLFMLVNPWSMLLIMAAVGLVDLYLFGELWMMGIRFNQVSIINMIMATGLAVDYVVYFAQKFMVVAGDGTRNSRMQIALADTGSAVFLGGFTALCGAVPMAFAKSVIIRTFFSLIFGTIIFSLAIGLMLMPVLLSLVGPPPVSSVMVAATAPPVATSEATSSGDSGELRYGKEGYEGQQPSKVEMV